MGYFQSLKVFRKNGNKSLFRVTKFGNYQCFLGLKYWKYRHSEKNLNTLKCCAGKGKSTDNLKVKEARRNEILGKNLTLNRWEITTARSVFEGEIVKKLEDDVLKGVGGKYSILKEEAEDRTKGIVHFFN